MCNGPVAQLGERLHGMQEVASSILVRSTIYNINPPCAGFLFLNLFPIQSAHQLNLTRITIQVIRGFQTKG